MWVLLYILTAVSQASLQERWNVGDVRDKALHFLSFVLRKRQFELLDRIAVSSRKTKKHRDSDGAGSSPSASSAARVPLTVQHRTHTQIAPPPAMAPTTRRNSVLAKKIATLELTLAPLVPLPSGPPHPAFPKTLMAFHLLTEAELDSIAHYYHQSTPGPWSEHYPASMNRDKKFLAHPAIPTTVTSPNGHRRRLSQQEQDFLTDLIKIVEDLQHPIVPSQPEEVEEEGVGSPTTRNNPYAGLSDKDRIRIKRRKVGKFIGLVGMETPAEGDCWEDPGES
ncbi:hypothetical protein LTR74_017272 [Friedmanniomyces endolithicus]|nr:hypothetical protein LTR74_017272 [Friedmanniomyces endolithicus]